MKRGLIALGTIAVAGVVAFELLSQERRQRLGASVRGRMLERMEKLMASLPENSPPKLIMSVLPQVREQNEQIIRMLREQNALLREQARTGH